MVKKSISSYKQNEVGIIPNDWISDKIKNIAHVIRGASPRPKGDMRYYGGDVPRLMVKDVTRDGKFVTPMIDFLTKEGEKRSRPCKKGTLTVVCSGTVGIPSFLAKDACIHDGFLALIDIKKNVYEDYLYHQLSNLRTKFESSATHGGIFTNLTTRIMEEFLVTYPPKKEEQIAIAQILSNADELINHLELLIEKKKNIKQGTMQELLTGKRRLEGFKEKWEIENIFDLCNDIFLGLTSKVEYVNQNGIPLVRARDISTGKLSFKETRMISVEQHRILTKIHIPSRGDVLLSKSGSLGVCALVDSDKEFSIYESIICLKPNLQKLLSEFLLELLRSSTIQNKLFSSTVGSTVGHINLIGFRKLKVFSPALDEQFAIAKILSDMDTEIRELEKKRDKYIIIKKGMMQKLLTGEIRLK